MVAVPAVIAVALDGCGTGGGDSTTASAAAPSNEPSGPTVTIAPGVEMPTVSLGTCCGSKPEVGLSDRLKAGGVAIDMAWNYHWQDWDSQEAIGQVLKDEAVLRESFCITTKLPGGDSHNASDCHEDPFLVVGYAQENLRKLGVDYVDLLLLHRPCEQTNMTLLSFDL